MVKSSLLFLSAASAMDMLLSLFLSLSLFLPLSLTRQPLNLALIAKNTLKLATFALNISRFCCVSKTCAERPKRSERKMNFSTAADPGYDPVVEAQINKRTPFLLFLPSHFPRLSELTQNTQNKNQSLGRASKTSRSSWPSRNCENSKKKSVFASSKMVSPPPFPTL